MKRLAKSAASGLLIMLATGCGDALTTVPDELAAVPEASRQIAPLNASDLPFRGSCSVSITAFIPIEFGPGGQLLRARQVIDGTCQLTHLGRTSVHLEQVTDYSVFPSRSTSTQLYTAANGDRLFATGVSLNGAPDESGNVTFTGMLTVTGGTGRFQNATASASASGGFNLGDLRGFYTLEGMIVRAPSNGGEE